MMRDELEQGSVEGTAANEAATAAAAVAEDVKPAPPVRWSPPEIQLLHDLAAQGLRVGVIALRLKRTHSSITYRARKEGIVFASFSRPRVEAGCNAEETTDR